MGSAADPQLARLVAKRIVARLRDEGHEAYFAGGCVRDELLGLHPTDFDIATDAPPARIRQLFPRTNEVGAAFGVMLVSDDGLLRPNERSSGSQRVTVEVATFRSDGDYTDSRRPDSVRFSDAPSDAARRDFTINALFLDPLAPPDPHARSAVRHAAASGVNIPREIDGRIIDFVGGVDDLHARVVRAVGDPDKRLAEDHLRALRAVRFAARLGFSIHPATADAIRRHAAELRGVSRERIGEELRRMLTHPSRATAVAFLEQLSLDSPVLNLPASGSGGGGEGTPDSSRTTDTPSILSRLSPSHPSAVGISTPARTEPTFATTLAAWALDRSGGLSALLSRDTAAQSHFGHEVTRLYRAALCLSNDDSRELSDVLDLFHTLIRRWDGIRVSGQKRAAARPAFAQTMCLLRAADEPRFIRICSIYKDLNDDGVGVNPLPLLTGDDLIAAGFKPGPRFKQVLDEVLDEQLEGRVRTREAALELARRLHV